MIDFHCHLDLYSDPERVLASAHSARMDILSVTTTPKAWRKTAALAAGKPRIRTALGLHPQLAHERFGELGLFESLLREVSYVGEIGLDGSPEYRQHAKIQTLVFERILSLCAECGGKILSVHSRRAAAPTLAALERFKCSQTAVLHWFSGTKSELSKAISIGCWFSVGPAMMRSAAGRRLVTLMPKERVLTETDGPFAKDVDKPLEPTDVSIAIGQLAELWQLDRTQTIRALDANLTSLLAEASFRGPLPNMTGLTA
jgi:TatD DNase family protein